MYIDIPKINLGDIFFIDRYAVRYSFMGKYKCAVLCLNFLVPQSIYNKEHLKIFPKFIHTRKHYFTLLISCEMRNAVYISINAPIKVTIIHSLRV